MIALNRLTGHSPGFFSVYSLPPNQAVSVKAQKKINAARDQTPPRRRVADIICRKTSQLIADCDEAVFQSLSASRSGARLLTGDSSQRPIGKLSGSAAPAGPEAV